MALKNIVKYVFIISVIAVLYYVGNFFQPYVAEIYHKKILTEKSSVKTISTNPEIVVRVELSYRKFDNNKLFIDNLCTQVMGSVGERIFDKMIKIRGARSITTTPPPCSVVMEFMKEVKWQEVEEQAISILTKTLELLPDNSTTPSISNLLNFNLLYHPTQLPSTIYLFFSAQTEDGKPKIGLQESDFELYEDDNIMSQHESSQTILPNPIYYVMATVLLLDMSGSIREAQTLEPLKNSAKSFVSKISGSNGQEVAIYTFDGRETLKKLIDFTQSTADLESALDSLTKDGVKSDPEYDLSTNLNGAILQGLDILDQRRDGIHNYRLFTGTLVTFTDAKHQADRVDNSRAVNAVNSSSHDSFSIGLGREIDKLHLSDIGKRGFEWAQNTDDLKEVFDKIAEDTINESKKYYVLGYCTPKRSGGHEVTLKAKGYVGILSSNFYADGFTSGCDPNTGGNNFNTIESIYENMVSIPAGTFKMGCSAGVSDCDSDEKPKHKVTISNGFKMSAYEITQGQWHAVMGSNPSHFNSCGSDCPVEQVSWDAVQRFISKLNRQSGNDYRLPTEAEWEYAARAGTTTKYYCGKDERCLGTIAWYENNSGCTTHPVGQKKANAWGLYDMSGNVFEWVQDCYDGSYCSPSTDPQGPSSGSGSAVRGGSWAHPGHFCRSSFRGRSAPSICCINIGFRLCLQ